ncbi:hypothetical protein GBN23_06365 [Plesiomonas shigelloides]|uniref:hypothetical protein n=1 Tax=Plesiomonas shigelloides TaxID=703 RepID=UPI0012621D79|nr:hypothetical protein [Plesiomonas shigelloides]KAB7681123.1 hypothetical protein GBN23_06365 [Plesiomonas shigelloides]
MTEKKGIALTDATYLLIIPAIAYALGYFFEFGYLSYYDVPSVLITTDIESMINAGIYMLLPLLSTLIWLAVALDASCSKKHSEKFAGTIMLFLLIPIIMFICKGGWWYLIVFIASLAIKLVIAILGEAESMSDKFRDKFSNLNESFFGDLERKPTENLYHRSKQFASVIFILLVPFLMSYTSGYNYARDKNAYDTFEYNNNKHLALIRVYGEKAIAIPFNINNDSLKKQYTILPLSELSKVMISKQNIGPLQKSDN